MYTSPNKLIPSPKKLIQGLHTSLVFLITTSLTIYAIPSFGVAPMQRRVSPPASRSASHPAPVRVQGNITVRKVGSGRGENGPSGGPGPHAGPPPMPHVMPPPPKNNRKKAALIGVGAALGGALLGAAIGFGFGKKSGCNSASASTDPKCKQADDGTNTTANGNTAGTSNSNTGSGAGYGTGAEAGYGAGSGYGAGAGYPSGYNNAGGNIDPSTGMPYGASGGGGGNSLYSTGPNGNGSGSGTTLSAPPPGYALVPIDKYSTPPVAGTSANTGTGNPNGSGNGNGSTSWTPTNSPGG